MKKLVWLLLALVVCIVPAGAAVTGEDIRSVGGDALADAVPAGQREYLDGIQPETADELAGSFARLLENVSEDSRSALQSAVRSLVRVAVVVILAAAARGFSSAAGGEADALIDMACAAVLLQDFSGVLALCRDTLEQISVFSGVLQPVLATALSVGGDATTATVLQVATMIVFDLIIRLVNLLADKGKFGNFAYYCWVVGLGSLIASFVVK